MPPYILTTPREIRESLGNPFGGDDLWIAAHALSLGCVLVMHNTKELSRIEGLVVEDWV